ncbi:hypothetical protein [Halorarum halobium]|uniref:hypothetical protein n=1 Tax=Halorarum halobium TaxID=3075121 RepID=UPI0028A5B769|nr:hypothetical protein [Halobaculum sp. XH14]
MRAYTADAVALLTYLVDALPRRADRLFAEAEAGEAIIHAPPTTVAETLYAVARDKTVRGIDLVGTPEATQQALLANGPVTTPPDTGEVLREYGRIADCFGLHDGLVIASHRAHTTEAVITTDGAFEDGNVETVW